MLFYSLHWEKKVFRKNRLTIIISGVTSEGQCVTIEKLYDEWLGICTLNIKKNLKLMKSLFPGNQFKYELLHEKQYEKILPNLKERLKKNSNHLNFKSKNFYKIYSSNALINDIGTVLNSYKISYYEPNDWLTRLYIDFCVKNNSEGFLYKWFTVTDHEMLLDSFKINEQFIERPNISIAAFDLETVSLDGSNRVPSGHDEADRIVFISIVKWSYKNESEIEKKLLFLNPTGVPISDKLPIDTNFLEFFSESDLLKNFHYSIEESQILTGYNIINFDLPCVIARMLWLNMFKEVCEFYSSKQIGKFVIPTFKNKLILDMYSFIQIFSGFKLTSFKLDNVAEQKLGKKKFPIKATAIHNYYVKEINIDILLSQDKEDIYNILKPNLMLSEFGTYTDCLKYCLEDSVLVYELFKSELTLTFLIERANLIAITVEQALYLGNTQYIQEFFKTYATLLGYFFNLAFFENTVKEDLEKYKDFLVLKNNQYSYQGALNLSKQGFYEEVASLDYFNYFPSILWGENLSYETCGLFFIEEYLNMPAELRARCQCIPYRRHSENDFLIKNNIVKYEHPKIDIDKDKLVMVSYMQKVGFLPQIIKIFLEKRKAIQKKFKETGDDNLYMRQLNIKLFLNSIYGAMACENWKLAYLDIAMTITCFSRLYLLAVSEFLEEKLGCETLYCDTDGIFSKSYELKDCNLINDFIGKPYLKLQFDKLMCFLLIICKKRYVYEENGKIHMSGFEKKANAVTRWMSEKIVLETFEALKKNDTDFGNGWIIWVNTLIGAYIMCRNPATFCITRKSRQLHEYKSSCPQLKIIKNNPHLAGQFIDYTYSQIDISKRESSKWITEVSDCLEVNFEKLFISQKKILVDLLNIAFFHLENPMKACDKVLNTMRWKNFVISEILSLKKFNSQIMILVLKTEKYTFNLNSILD